MMAGHHKRLPVGGKRNGLVHIRRAHGHPPVADAPSSLRMAFISAHALARGHVPQDQPIRLGRQNVLTVWRERHGEEKSSLGPLPSILLTLAALELAHLLAR